MPNDTAWPACAERGALAPRFGMPASHELMPEHVARQRPFEVADACDGGAAGMHTEVDAAGPDAVGHLPLVDIAGRRVEEQNVARGVIVEVADAGNLIAGRMTARAGG